MTRADAFIVLGATGHIGSVVARTLLRDGHQIVAVVHDEAKAAGLKSLGAEIAIVDLGDTQALRATLRRGRRAFLLNPPAPVTTDTNAGETRTATSIAEAVGGAGLEKVVVESTYGAQPGDAIGDLSVLWNFERAVGAAAVPAAINRGAYYYTNLDMLPDEARQGSITTMFPAQLKIPMVAPADLGLAAARRLASPLDDVGIRYVEGPEAYSFGEVAAAFAEILGHAVTVRTIERSEWEASFMKAGFSERAAHAYARMTEVSLAGFDMPENPIRGTINLRDYISTLVKEKWAG
ncbi:putative nucleoside-diphosphate sugar epimerase [Rhizobium leguminosarum bv. trifolii WSM597]|uniref:Putative nucleoside-diphosphate sugar epimerase n=1 Tax=Rhizobium leguminosarum bv. trifolii WSM597 TaxID=754764 RepID=I9N578_RHILT|nr:NmrA family NAD(P)-binding protein [Rhizobium leguminosarum]EJB01822.1 putative nucleoside-diphosphate sugar epimerase [Rhizobium leguminosarum bv. trifolii WSM597]